MPIFTDLKNQVLAVQLGHGDIGMVRTLIPPSPDLPWGFGSVWFCQIPEGPIDRDWTKERQQDQPDSAVRLSFANLHSLEVVMRSLAGLHEEMGKAWIKRTISETIRAIDDLPPGAPE